jgi:multidrug efflux pump subunit AcrA (membrane-fusion protein)
MKLSSATSTSETTPPPTSVGVLVAGGSLQHISGEPFPALTAEDTKALSAERTTIRQVDKTLLVSTPFGSGRHMLFAYADMPDGMSAIDLARHVEEKSLTSAQALAKASQQSQPADPGDADSFVTAVTASIPFRSKRRLEGFVRELTNSGFSRHVVAGKLRGSKLRGLRFSNPELNNAKTELLFVVQEYLAAEEPHENPIDTLNADLVAEQMGGRKLNIFLPSTPGGIAVIATDVSPQDRDKAELNMKLLTLLAPHGYWTQWVKRLLGWSLAASALIGLVAYMAVPANVYIRGAAMSTSGDTATLALSFPAFLERSYVRPGEVLKAGDQIMTLRSPELDQALEEEKLSLNLEKLNAQDALERNDFNSFQLAQSRQNLSATRLEQLEYRLGLLDVRAREDARILSVLPNTMAGGFLNIGAELVRLQSTQVFEAQIDVNPVDAARLRAGQAGELFFKGLPGQVFTIETTSVPISGPSPDGQTFSLTIEAKVVDQDQSALIPGLSGYAKINVGEAPRFVAVFRKVTDYVRFNLWKFLGFDI